MIHWKPKEEYLVHLNNHSLIQIGLMMPKSSLRLLGIHCIFSLFGEVKTLWAQSDLDQDNAQIQEQILVTQHPMLEDMPDRCVQSVLNLPWIIKNRLPWNKSLEALTKDTLGLSHKQCKAMDSLVRVYGRPTHAAFWMMIPWMEAATAFAFQRAMDREFPIIDMHSRILKSGIDIFYGTRYVRTLHEYDEPVYDERWQYRIGHQFRNIGWVMTFEKPTDRSIADLPGFFMQGKRELTQWLIGDFHPQSGNRLFHNTLRIPAFANPWAHLPGTEIPYASSRMNGGNQVRGLALQTAWRHHLLVMNSYALGSFHIPHSDSATEVKSAYVPIKQRKILWIHSMAWQMEKPWGIFGLQSALPSVLTIPSAWNPTILTTQSLQPNNPLIAPDQFSKDLQTFGINYHIQRRNYFFQSNLAIHPAISEKPLNKNQDPYAHSSLDIPQALDISQLHTLIITPHPHWSLGMRWSKLSQGSEAKHSINLLWPKEGPRQALDLNAQWSPVPYWSITMRSHWVEEGPIHRDGDRFIAWNRGLEGRILKGPFKESRYTMIYKQAERGSQGDYLFQYLRMPWPISAQRGDDHGRGGYVQITHGYSSPAQQTWALAYNILWRRIFRTRADFKMGQTWVIAGSEGERVTVREDQSFGAGWWTGSSGQYRFTASLQGRSGSNGWRFWVRRIEDEETLRWETGLAFSQRWNEN